MDRDCQDKKKNYCFIFILSILSILFESPLKIGAGIVYTPTRFKTFPHTLRPTPFLSEKKLG